MCEIEKCKRKCCSTTASTGLQLGTEHAVGHGSTQFENHCMMSLSVTYCRANFWECFLPLPYSSYL